MYSKRERASRSAWSFPASVWQLGHNVLFILLRPLMIATSP